VSKPFLRSTAGPRANHCPDLLRRAATPAEPETRFAEISADLAGAFCSRLSGLLGGARLRATCTPVDPLPVGDLAAKVGSPAAHSVLHFPAAAANVLLSIPLQDLLALTDRAFGGSGDGAEQLPEELPLTADLVAGQLEDMLAQSFASALGSFAQPDISGRGPDLSRLEPFAGLAECRTFTVTVSETDGPSWTFRLTVCSQGFATLFAAKPKIATARPARDPAGTPFADVPLAVEAVVAEFTLPLARLSALKCGDTIPLTLSREVPLRILETTIAYGSVGAADERAALQLTRVF
jgi:flagellar motor switch protein FliM